MRIAWSREQLDHVKGHTLHHVDDYGDTPRCLAPPNNRMGGLELSIIDRSKHRA